MPRHKRTQSGSQRAKVLRTKKRLITRRVKTRKIEIISRKTQPKVFANVPVLIEDSIGGPVASSWIAAIQWDKKNRDALMYLLNGYFYVVKISFKKYQNWYFAHSKGTFFNEQIKDKFTVIRKSPK